MKTDEYLSLIEEPADQNVSALKELLSEVLLNPDEIVEFPQMGQYFDDDLTASVFIDWDFDSRITLRWPLELLLGDLNALTGDFIGAEQRYSAALDLAIRDLDDPSQKGDSVDFVYQAGCEMMWRQLSLAPGAADGFWLVSKESITGNWAKDVASAPLPPPLRTSLANLALTAFNALKDHPQVLGLEGKEYPHWNIWLFGMWAMIRSLWEHPDPSARNWVHFVALSDIFWVRWFELPTDYALSGWQLKAVPVDIGLSTKTVLSNALIEAPGEQRAEEASRKIKESDRIESQQRLQDLFNSDWDRLEHVQINLSTAEMLYRNVDKGIPDLDWACVSLGYWKAAEIFFESTYLPEVRRRMPEAVRHYLTLTTHSSSKDSSYRPLGYLLNFVQYDLPKLAGVSDIANSTHMYEIAKTLISWLPERNKMVHGAAQDANGCMRLRRDVLGDGGHEGIVQLMLKGSALY